MQHTQSYSEIRTGDISLHAFGKQLYYHLRLPRFLPSHSRPSKRPSPLIAHTDYKVPDLSILNLSGSKTTCLNVPSTLFEGS